jgi:hypothetical protein
VSPPDLFPHALERHVKVARMLGDTLTLGAPEDWEGFAIVARRWLTQEERQALAWAALEAEGKIEPVFPSIGSSTPRLSRGDPIEEAADWCNLATAEEIKAYAFACFLSMPPEDKAKFLRFAQRRTSA